MSCSRRRFIQMSSTLFLSRFALGCGGDDTSEASGTPSVASSFGELVKDPDGLIDLPEGFSYTVLERTGDLMSDGFSVQERPDGMACFWDDEGRYVLMRNHEVDEGGAAVLDVAFNPNRGGGVSRVVVDPNALTRTSSNWVLVGTSRNCAGGPSPWGWLSCEETTESGHGYVFLTDPSATEAQAPRRARSFGRFNHEAVAIDTRNNIAYLTEDFEQGCLYRHVPRDKDAPFDGRLQALAIKGVTRKDLGADDLTIGQTFEVSWVFVADPEGEEEPTYQQAQDAGAAIVRRGEGIWWSDGSVFFASTSGGPNSGGQIFRLDPTETGGTLTLVAQADGSPQHDFFMPDNLTVAPWGDLIVCEDKDQGACHVQRVRLDGTVEPLVRNALDGGVSEFCGVCFSPDGKVMFVNMQEPGITFAIRGPFVS